MLQNPDTVRLIIGGLLIIILILFLSLCMAGLACKYWRAVAEGNDPEEREPLYPHWPYNDHDLP